MNKKEIKKGCHPEESLFRISSLFISNRKAGGPEQQHLRTTCCAAFTLIELLVVVLIIGILAAVALPQYEAAVAKSRFSALIPIVDGYKKSLDMYYLANGEYPPDTCDEIGFDIKAPDNCSGNGSTCAMSCGNGIEYDVLDYGTPNVVGINHNTGNGYVVWASISDHPNERRCLATATNKIANQVCKSFGGEEVSGENYQYATLNLGTLKVYKF